MKEMKTLTNKKNGQVYEIVDAKARAAIKSLSDDGYDKFYDSIARMSVNPVSPLNISTYDGSNKLTQPKVLYIPNGFGTGTNTYKYWMVYTPLPDNDLNVKNPCLAYSNDGYNFISNGINNPIFGPPMIGTERSGYNSDPTLVLVNGVLEIWWRTYYQNGENASYEVIYRVKSRNGFEWSELEELFRSESSSASTVLSPTVIYEDGIYKIWCVYKQRYLKYYESSTGGNNWIYRRDIEVHNTDNPDYLIWHFDIIHSDKGYEFVGVYHPSNDYDDKKYIYYASSEDNITYSERLLILQPGDGENFDKSELDKPSIVRNGNNIKIYYGARNGWGNWKIGLIEGPSPYLFNAILRNSIRLKTIENEIALLKG